METITAEELEEKFDNNEDVSEYMDFTRATRLSSFLQENEVEEINIKFPKSIITLIDKKIDQIGINRESFIKMIVAEN